MHMFFFNIFFTCCRKMDADKQKYFILVIRALNFVKDTQARLCLFLKISTVQSTNIMFM